MVNTKKGIYRADEDRRKDGYGPVIITGKHNRDLAITAAEVYGEN